MWYVSLFAEKGLFLIGGARAGGVGSSLFSEELARNLSGETPPTERAGRGLPFFHRGTRSKRRTLAHYLVQRRPLWLGPQSPVSIGLFFSFRADEKRASPSAPYNLAVAQYLSFPSLQCTEVSILRYAHDCRRGLLFPPRTYKGKRKRT